MEIQLNLKEYTINEINFNEVDVITHDGLIFDNIKENISYIYDRDSVNIFEKGTKDIYVGFC